MTDADIAATYLDKLISHERNVAGKSREAALREIGRRIGASYWTIWGIYTRRRKTPGWNLVRDLRLAHLANLERQVLAMMNDIEIERDLGHDDDELEDIASEVAALKAKITSKRTFRTGGGEGLCRPALV